MSYSIVFRILGGSFEEGYEIEAEIRRDQKIICTELGRLQPKPEIPQLYEQTFPVHYANWGSRSQWGRVIEYGDGVEAVRSLCLDTSQELARTFQLWFRHADLGAIQTRIIQHIPSGSAPVVILEANRHRILQCLPWHQWDWLNNEFPNTEIVLSRKAFKVTSVKKRQRILVVLGSEEGIDLQPDWEALTKNFNTIADLILLLQPKLSQLRDQISQGCDILFFAGHSDRNQSGDNGWIKINATQTISIDDLIPELRSATKKGLRLIMLNSCSGMGIASRLSELEIPYMVVMREPIHNDVAGKFIEYCLKNLAEGNSLTRSVSQARNKLRNLEDKYICASWMPIIFQSREAPDYIPFPRRSWQRIWHKLLLHSSRWLTQSKVIKLGRKPVKLPPIGFVVIGLLAVLIISRIPSCGSPPEILESMGERSLFSQKISPVKQEGIEFFRSKAYAGAIEKFNMAMSQNSNDPETQIYINNARALQQSKDQILPIIPVVSSSSNGFQTAQETLRGASIAQMDINQKGGIKNQQVLLKIILDNNDKEEGIQVANKLVKDPTIKAVVGHLNSNPSAAAAPIYQANGLVMISPTSSGMNLTGQGQFILRTSVNSEMMANTLADHVINTAKKKRLGICINPALTSAVSFKEEFGQAISRRNGKILTNISCSLLDKNLSPSPQEIVDRMVKQGAEGLVIYFHADNGIEYPDMQMAQKIARVAKQRNLPLFGPHALIAPDILKLGSDFEGMTLVTPRHPESPLASKFTSQTRAIFGTEPTWRDMTTYDATVAIAVGLNISNGTRNDLQMKLHDPNFSIEGSSGPIKFSHSGDRVMTSSISQVQCRQNNQCKFALIPSVESKPTKIN
jgi:branched-chain amino acid transport system substrate-binding protein